MIKKNDEIELYIEDIGSEGEGIGHYDGMAFFVTGGIVGDRILAGVTKLKKTYGYARLIRILEPSPDRVEPVCPASRLCGGCQLQCMSYEAQKKFKYNKVLNDFVRIGGFGRDDFEMNDVIGMDEQLHYRNKAQFPVGKARDGHTAIGFYRNHSHEIVDCLDCGIQHELNSAIMRAFADYMEESKVTPYDEEAAARGDRKCGIVRHVLTRVGFKTHEVMVCVVINADRLPAEELLVEKLREAVRIYRCQQEGDVAGSPAGEQQGKSIAVGYELVSLSYSVNRKDTNVILGDNYKVIYGQPYITDYIKDVRYRISPLSFYQVNPVQTEKLYSKALEYAGLTGSETVWDLYCGIGTISLFLAKSAKKVYGVEIVPQAIEDARQNAVLNGIDNAEFFVGASEEVLPAYVAENPGAHADVIVVDPPRKGCERKLLECIAGMNPDRIVYVSCDPATLSRDVRILSELGYLPRKVQPVDMFPSTVHVESVTLLERN